MTRIIGVSRNIEKHWIIVILFALFLILVPTKLVPFEEITTIPTVEAQVETVIDGIVQENRTIFLPGEVSENITPTIIPIRDIRNLTNSSGSYAYQPFLITLDEPVDDCLLYDYTLLEDDREINNEKGQLCFNASLTQELELSERFTGDIDDHTFIVDIAPATRKVYREDAIRSVEVLNVTQYRNVTTYINTTTNETTITLKRVNWMFGFRWWFLE